MNTIGLKYFWKDYKTSSFKHKLKQLKYELRYAFKRAWLGYDDVDVFECFERFRVRTILILERFKETRVGLWWVPEESEHYEQLGYLDAHTNKRVFSNEDMNIIIDTMIWHLKMMDEDFVEKQLYGSCIYDENYRFDKFKTIEETRRISNVMVQNKEAFMKLFNMFYFDLWD
jgi:hypothetical protein